MKRRANNEGSIFKDSRGYWVAEFMFNGKKKRKTSKRQSVVREWLQRSLAEVVDGTYVEPSRIPFGEFCDRFLNDVASATLRDTTVASYRQFVELHIKPDLGSIRLDQVKPAHLQSLYRKKLDGGLSKRSVEYLHVIIKRILNQAVKWGMLARNPADAAEPPRPDKKAPVMLTLEQIQILLDASRNHDHFPIYCIAIGCGLRQGEILGLRCKDVDLENFTLRVNQTVVTLHGKPYISKPKSATSVRTVGLPNWVRDAIEPVMKGLEPDDLLFKSRDGGMMTRSMIGHHFNRVLDANNLPRVHFHSLRHSNITMLLAAHIPPRDVQAHAGHSSFQVTMDIYGHVMPDAERKAASALDDKFRTKG